HEQEILADWIGLLKVSGAGLQTGRLKEGELLTQCTTLLSLVRQALGEGSTDVSSRAYEPLRGFLADISRSRALQGFSSSETARFVFSLKEPLFNMLHRAQQSAPGDLPTLIMSISLLIDNLGINAIEVYQKSREEVIVRQQREIAELSTPVVK